MDRKLGNLLAIGIALAALMAPVGIAIYVARWLASGQEQDRALQYARDVLNRSDAMVGQVELGVEKLRAATDPCSAANIDAMRQVDLGSSYIQAIGHVAGNRLECSSIAGQFDEGFDLGPPDSITPRGTRVRYSVRFPFAANREFLVLESGGYAAIIHKDLPLDATTNENGVSLAVFSTSPRRIAASRGTVRTSWMAALGSKGEVTFREGGHVVAVVASKRFYSGAIAALPDTGLDSQARRFAMVLVPIGGLAGLLLALAILYVLRVQQAMPSIIRAALRRDEFFLQYQPIVELGSGRWIGAEALIRWRRPSGEMVRPDIFIQVAEDSGLIQQITARVFELIAKDASNLFQRHPGFHIAINLSPFDLQSRHTLELLRRLAAATGAADGNLVVEATERGLLNESVTRDLVQELRDSGFRVAVDDFGTGYSSLSYLQAFALDMLKIDKSFIDTIGAEAATSHVVSHIIEMAKDLRLEMVAEGVEHEAQARYLRERGVQFAQGWLFGRPMALADLVAKLTDPEAPDPLVG